jgi:hypothetical protein
MTEPHTNRLRAGAADMYMRRKDRRCEASTRGSQREITANGHRYEFESIVDTSPTTESPLGWALRLVSVSVAENSPAAMRGFTGRAR